MLASASCQTPSGGASPEPTVPSSAAAEGAACPDRVLRTPQGAPIDLSGTWTTGDTESGNLIVYELRQSGECLWGRAYSAYLDQEPGQSFELILVGTVSSDFTVRVDLLELHVDNDFYSPFDRASATCEIGFGSAEGDETVTLTIATLQARAVLPGGPLNGRLFPTGGPTVGHVLNRSP